MDIWIFQTGNVDTQRVNPKQDTGAVKLVQVSPLVFKHACESERQRERQRYARDCQLPEEGQMHIVSPGTGKLSTHTRKPSAKKSRRRASQF